MGRAKRADGGGMVFHVLNHANARATIFEKPADDAAVERVLQEALDRVEMRVLSYCRMPNHWHLVLWPRRDGDLSQFLGEWPVPCPRQWRQNVKQPQSDAESDAEIEALRSSVNRGSPIVESDWTKRGCQSVVLGSVQKEILFVISPSSNYVCRSQNTIVKTDEDSYSPPPTLRRGALIDCAKRSLSGTSR